MAMKKKSVMNLQLLLFSNGKRCHIDILPDTERSLYSLPWKTAAIRGFGCYFFLPLPSLVEKVIFLLSEFGNLWPLTPICTWSSSGSAPGWGRGQSKGYQEDGSGEHHCKHFWRTLKIVAAVPGVEPWQPMQMSSPARTKGMAGSSQITLLCSCQPLFFQRRKGAFPLIPSFPSPCLSLLIHHAGKQT